MIFVDCGILGLGAAVYMKRSLFTIQRPTNGRMWGYITVPQGETWSITRASGRLETVGGPRVVWTWGDLVCQLEQVSASPDQYLAVQLVDGRAEILPGPARLYRDPNVHRQVKVKSAVMLNDNEVLVVYRDGAAAAGPDPPPAGGGARQEPAIARHVVPGPCLYIPRHPSEWVQEFRWHGGVSNDPSANARKAKDATRFTKLRVCPEQTYFDVEGVRTKDDALVTVKVMIFYRLQDIGTMLRETHDPIADFINSVTSDVIEFVAGRSFEEFKASTDQLNNLALYRQLTSRAMSIGFEITKVVFRGYGAPERLQKMHDDGIERRTKLALERENEDQEQSLLDMKLAREEGRLRKKQAMEKETSVHDLELQRLAHEARQQEVLGDRQARLGHLSEMKARLGIAGDQLASYLLASEQGPPSKLVVVQGSKEGTSAGGSFVQIVQDSA